MKAIAGPLLSPGFRHLAARFGIAAGLMWLMITFVQPPPQFQTWLDSAHRGESWLGREEGPRDAISIDFEALANAEPPPIAEFGTGAESIDLSGDEAIRVNAETAVVAKDLVPAPRFVSSLMDAPSYSRASECLAAAAWYEAGDDPVGERAVVQVVLNRVRHPSYPASICAVVFQGSERQTGCQFTFTCDGSMLNRAPGAAALGRARAIAMAAMAGQVDANVGTATHYHADYVVPKWRNRLVKIATVGRHIFYRWAGQWGSRELLARSTSRIEEPIVAQLAALSPFHTNEGKDGQASLADLELAENAVELAARARPAGATERSPGTRPAAGQPVIAIQLNRTASPGSFAMRALEACKGAETCNVLGWSDSRLLSNALPLSREATTGLEFLYMKRNGTEGLYWSCASYVRPDARQCMPTGAALDRLLNQG